MKRSGGAPAGSRQRGGRLVARCECCGTPVDVVTGGEGTSCYRPLAEAVVKALEDISKKQPVLLKLLQRNEIVFNDIGNDPGDWQHVAFTVYGYLCEVDSMARAAVAEYRQAEGAET